jgi:hypothetical protein
MLKTGTSRNAIPRSLLMVCARMASNVSPRARSGLISDSRRKKGNPVWRGEPDHLRQVRGFHGEHITRAGDDLLDSLDKPARVAAAPQVEEHDVAIDEEREPAGFPHSSEFDRGLKPYTRRCRAEAVGGVCEEAANLIAKGAEVAVRIPGFDAVEQLLASQAKAGGFPGVVVGTHERTLERLAGVGEPRPEPPE